MNIRYEIQDNIIYMYNEYDICFLKQDFNPAGAPWKDVEEMEQWASDFIAETERQLIANQEARLELENNPEVSE